MPKIKINLKREIKIFKEIQEKLPKEYRNTVKKDSWCNLSLESKKEYLLKNRPVSEVLLEKILIENYVSFEPQAYAHGYWLDFQILPSKLGVEVDGSYHFTPEQNTKDKNRTENLEKYGWTLLRFSDGEIRNNPKRVVSEIKLERDRKLLAKN